MNCGATGPHHLPDMTFQIPLPIEPARDAVPPAQWAQRWRAGQATWRHASERLDPTRYRIVTAGRAGQAEITVAQARAWTVTNHYSATWPATSHVYVLLDTAGARPTIVGVAAYSVPMSASVLTNVAPDLEPITESIELGRFALADRVPYCGESWFLARTFRRLADEGVRAVVAFSDPVARTRADGTQVLPGHHGGIYRASNARQLGRGTARTLTLLPDGTCFSDRAAQKIRADEQGVGYASRQLHRFGAPTRRPGESGESWLARALPAIGARRLRHPGNLRFGFAIGPPAERRRVRLVAPNDRPHTLPDTGERLAEHPSAAR